MTPRPPKRAMLLVMTEHTFPSGLLRGSADDLLSAAILHHLLVRAPDGCTRAEMALRLIGRRPTPHEDATLAVRVTRLRAEGLIGGDARRIEASPAARAFHRIMLGGGPPPGAHR